MKKVVKVNKERCIGCGMCVGINSEVFSFEDDGLATADNKNINEDNKDEVNDAIDSCPVSAIEVIDDDLETDKDEVNPNI